MDAHAAAHGRRRRLGDTARVGTARPRHGARPRSMPRSIPRCSISTVRCPGMPPTRHGRRPSRPEPRRLHRDQVRRFARFSHRARQHPCTCTACARSATPPWRWSAPHGRCRRPAADRAVSGPARCASCLDPRRRLGGAHRVFHRRRKRRRYWCTPPVSPYEATCRTAVETLRCRSLRRAASTSRPLLAALRALRRGRRGSSSEDGARTVTAFLQSGLLSRLQVAVAPLLIGAGRPSVRCRALMASPTACARAIACSAWAATCCSTWTSRSGARAVNRTATCRGWSG